MLAIAQSGNKYHYLNWIPSESGPLVTHFGNVIKEIDYVIGKWDIRFRGFPLDLWSGGESMVCDAGWWSGICSE